MNTVAKQAKSNSVIEQPIPSCHHQHQPNSPLYFTTRLSQNETSSETFSKASTIACPNIEKNLKKPWTKFVPLKFSKCVIISLHVLYV